jgi:NAD(P)H dehydrogenase (quinone)
LEKMHALNAKPNYPIATPELLAGLDGFLLGIPTRYGNMPAQLRAFWDSTGQLWAKGQLAGKYAGIFISTASPGGGQESTAYTAMSTLAHHGILYVPLGYKHAFAELSNLEEVHGSKQCWLSCVSYHPDFLRRLAVGSWSLCRNRRLSDCI